ncbi:MAG: hypothetical protein K2N98_00745 [Lachnospiraceae bacterium]|nr:hypothetical protein [Lachnospiraceae bacterium]
MPPDRPYTVLDVFMFFCSVCQTEGAAPRVVEMWISAYSVMDKPWTAHGKATDPSTFHKTSTH